LPSNNSNCGGQNGSNTSSVYLHQHIATVWTQKTLIQVQRYDLSPSRFQYCLFPCYNLTVNLCLSFQSESQVPPMRSRSGRPIESDRPYTSFPLIGYHAPTIKDITSGRWKQTPKRPTLKKTSRRVCARIGPTDQSAVVSAETPTPPALPTTEMVDPQTAAEVGAAAASLLVEAVQVTSHTSHIFKYSININFSLLPGCTDRPSAIPTAIGHIPSGS
jgi:hypothetical protein